MKHQLLFTDSGSAGVICSLKPNIDNPQILLAYEIQHCRYCRNKLQLEWNVRIREI